MSTVDQLREALAKLPASDGELEVVSGLINKVEREHMAGAASTVALQSIINVVDNVFFKYGSPCPVCRRERKHSVNCYLRASGGWDLLAEHEATLHENDELRSALAKHLPHNGASIRAGAGYRSLKDRARRKTT